MWANSFTLFCFLSNIALIFSTPVNDIRCTVDLSARQSCGQANNVAECAVRGCCYDECLGKSCTSGIPNCYLSSYLIESDECQVEDSGRQDCGFEGISLDACLIKGCCWKPSPNKDVPWCFYSKTNSNQINTLVGGIEWSSFENGNLPSRSDAVVVEDCYVGRVKALGGVFPGKIHSQWGAAFFGVEGLEASTKNFEALINKEGSLKLVWKPAQNGDIPTGAVVGGHAINDPSHLYYVAKGRTTGGDQPGYLDPEAGCAVIPYGLKSECLTSYKILVQESP